MDTTHIPSRLSFPTESSVRYYYRGALRLAVYPNFQIDAEMERIRDEDPSVDDSPLGLPELRRQAITRILLRNLGHTEDREDEPAEQADAANADELLRPGTVVRLREGGDLARVKRSDVDRGVRVYDVESGEWGVMRGLLYKELERVEGDAVHG